MFRLLNKLKPFSRNHSRLREVFNDGGFSAVIDEYRKRNPSYKGSSCFCEHLGKTGRYNTELDVIANYEALVEDTREWLDYKDYKIARVVMDYMLETKVRRDGTVKFRDDKKTPDPLHEITQAITFVSMLEEGFFVDDPELVLATIFAHDLGEDYGIRPRELDLHLAMNGIRLDQRTEDFIWAFDAMSKSYLEEKKFNSEGEYQRNLQKNLLASVAKMFDRAHNIMTLIGVRVVNQTHLEIALSEHYYDKMFMTNMCADFPQNEPLYRTMDELLKLEDRLTRYLTTDDARFLFLDIPVEDSKTGETMIINEKELNEVFADMPKKGFTYLPGGFNALHVIAERIRAHPRPHYLENKRTIQICAACPSESGIDLES